MGDAIKALSRLHQELAQGCDSIERHRATSCRKCAEGVDCFQLRQMRWRTAQLRNQVLDTISVLEELNSSLDFERINYCLGGQE